MNPKLYQQVKEIVANALELPQDKRADYLDGVCQFNDNLRSGVDDLLSQMVDSDFLNQDPLLEITNDTEQLSGQIGRIKIDKLIATGGMGEVYLGTDVTLNRQVALKILNQEFLLSQISRAAFLNEAQVLSSLQHPNICQVYDFFREDKKDVLVLELIDGKTLRQLFDSKLKINPIDISIQLTKGLTAAHERGIVHRDLKPDNIMINQSGLVKILDFGLARTGLHEQAILNDKSYDKLTDNSNKTQVSGTPGYMSPEQARGEKSSTATDMWSFGLILSELFSGQLPFSAQSSSKKLIEQTKKAKVSIPTNIGNAEQILIKQLLSEDVKKRPTARVVMNQLLQIKKRPMRRLRNAIIASLILLTIFTVWKYTSDIQQEKNIAVIARADAEDLVGFMLDDLNQQLKALGKLDILESVANKAMSYYDNNDANLSASDGQGALVLVKISEVLDEKGRKKEAVELLQRAIDAFEVLDKEQSNSLIKYRLGMAYLSLGELLKIKGEFQPALVKINKAVNLGKSLKSTLSLSNKPTDTENLDLYLSSMYQLSDTYRRMDNNDISMSLIDEALIIAVPAAQKYPILTKILADFYYKQCSVYVAQDRKDIMLESCLNAMDADKKLYDANKNNINLRTNYAADHFLIANIYRHRNDRNKALEIVSNGLLHYQELVAWDTNNSRLQNELAGALIEKARILYELNRFDEAQKLFEEGHAILVPLAQDREEITYLHNLLFSSMYLGKLTLAREIADIIIQRGMKTNDLKELLIQLKVFEEEQKND